VPTGFYTYIR